MACQGVRRQRESVPTTPQRRKKDGLRAAEAGIVCAQPWNGREILPPGLDWTVRRPAPMHADSEVYTHSLAEHGLPPISVRPGRAIAIGMRRIGDTRRIRAIHPQHTGENRISCSNRHMPLTETHEESSPSYSNTRLSPSPPQKVVPK